MTIDKAYRGTEFDAMHTEHYAIYASTDYAVANRYGKNGKVYSLDLSELTIVSVDDLPALLSDSTFAEYADLDPDTIDLDAAPLFGIDGECYTLAAELNIDGIIDHKGNIEIYNGLDIIVIDSVDAE